MSHPNTLYEAKMAESGFTGEDALTFGYYFATDASVVHPDFDARAGVVLPYYDPDGTPSTDYCRVRYLEPPKGFSTNTAKYVQPRGTSPRAYFPRGVPWADLLPADTPLFITEGEFKAACMSKHGWPTVGIGGVYNWMCKRDGDDLIPDLAQINWVERSVFLVFDSDARSNPQVKGAMVALANKLLENGAVVRLIVVPAMAGGKAGADDYIVAHGKEAFSKLVETADEYGMSAEMWQFDSEVAWVLETDSVINLESGLLYTPAALVNGYYANRNYVETITNQDGSQRFKTRNVAKEWLKWPLRGEIQRITFKPGEDRITEQNEFNLWRGWGVEPKRGTCTPWRDLLNHLFDGDKEKIKWFEQWCAYQVQHPGKKQYSACLIWGRHQGTGKSLVGVTLRKIFGQHSREVRTDQLLGSFNAWAASTQFVLGDEIGIFDGPFTDRRVAGGHMKSLITRETITVNRKFQQEYEVPDCISYYLTSNHQDSFHIEPGDRRWFVHEVINSPMSHEFYKLYDAWMNADGPRHLMYRLLNIDLGDYNSKANALHTSDKDDMIRMASGELDFWVDTLVSSPDQVLTPSHTCDLYTAQQMLALYDPTGKTRVTQMGMARAMKRHGLVAVQRVPTNGGWKSLWILRERKHWVELSNKPRHLAAHYDAHHPTGDAPVKY